MTFGVLESVVDVEAIAHEAVSAFTSSSSVPRRARNQTWSIAVEAEQDAVAQSPTHASTRPRLPLMITEEL